VDRIPGKSGAGAGIDVVAKESDCGVCGRS
jgi:hypothetical protein